MSDALPVRKSQKGAANWRNDRAGKTEFEQFPGFPNKVHIQRVQRFEDKNLRAH